MAPGGGVCCGPRKGGSGQHHVIQLLAAFINPYGALLACCCLQSLQTRCHNVHQLLQREALPPELMALMQQRGQPGVMHMQQPLPAPLLLQVCG